MRDERIADIDAVRGSALFGILIVNAMAFSSAYYGSGVLPPEGRSELDAFLAFLISTLFELKFYLLFSFLFGYSVTLQIRSAERAGADFLTRMIRRQAGLFAIGAAHASILFHGDILTTYALLGLLLIAVRGWSDTAMLRLCGALILATSAFWLLVAGLFWSEPALADPSTVRREADRAVAAFRGAPGAIMAQHLSTLRSFLPMLLLLQAPCALAMFLLGFVSGRRRVFEDRAAWRPYLKHARWLGFAIGLPGGLVYAAATQFTPGSPAEIAALALSIVTAPFLIMALIATLTGLLDASRTGPLRAIMADAGRMALTNYLLQSLLCAFVFHGYGLGLVGGLSIAQTLMLAIAIYMLQLIFSRWWLRRFRYGPLEWLLRAITVRGWPGFRTPVRMDAR